jgi:hypothetical protein
MTRAIRPSTPADAGAIVALLAQAGLQPSVGPQELRWRYWLPRADWPEPRSYILTQGSTPIAHGAVVPGAWLSGSRRLRVVHAIDWVAQRGAVGAGAMLMKYIGQRADALLAVGGSAETRRLLPNLGFRAAGAVHGYVRTLHPLRLLKDAGGHPLRRLYRAARAAARVLGAPRAPPADWVSRRLTAATLHELSAVLPASRPGLAVGERSVALFAYALECPILPLAVHLVERAGRARGYFLLTSAPGQVRIGDCWLDSDDVGDWSAMLALAVAEATADPQAAEIVGWANDTLTARALEACGFRGMGATGMLLRPTGETALPEEPLRVQMIDSDAAYLHHGRREFWS